MGLFDEIVFSTKCPYCNTWQTFAAQTKAFKGRCQWQYRYMGNPKHFFSPHHKNDKIPLNDFDPETRDAKTKKKGYILAGTTCSSPFCLWYSTRREILLFGEPHALGRSLNVKVPFNKKTGELQQPTFILTPQTPEEELRKAFKILFYANPKGVKLAAQQAGYEPLLILLQYARNDKCQHFKPKSNTHAKKESSSLHTTSKASKAHSKK